SSDCAGARSTRATPAMPSNDGGTVGTSTSNLRSTSRCRDARAPLTDIVASVGSPRGGYHRRHLLQCHPPRTTGPATRDGRYGAGGGAESSLPGGGGGGVVVE